MAKAMTGTFTISATALVSSLGTSPTAIPIGSLIDVGDAQALEIESVDYIWQNVSAGTTYEVIHDSAPFSTDAAFGAQLTDRNSQSMLIASDNNLISSGAAYFDLASGVQSAGDFFPDDFQKNAGRFVVNDELYLLTQAAQGTFATNQQLACTVRVRAKVVKLSTRDWMAISLETVQNE